MEIKTLAEGKFLGLYARSNWEFTDRPNSTGVVGILPITDDGQLVLVEQFRIPVQARVIEIPAGLVGDEEEFIEESLAECAARELLEETGYTGTLTPLLSSPTSAGMTTETTHFFAATELKREHEGGGTEHEDIIVHHVSIADLAAWLTEKQSQGLLIEYKIHACICLAQQQGVIPFQTSN